MGSERVAYIGLNPISRRPTVWVTQGKRLCQAELGVARRLRGTAPQAQQQRESASTRGPRPAQDPRIDSVVQRIQRVDPHEVLIARGAVESVLADPVALLRGVRIDPRRGPGIGLLGIRPGAILHALGLRQGDRLLSINGQTLLGLEDAMALYARLRTASDLQLEIARGRARTTLNIGIR